MSEGKLRSPRPQARARASALLRRVLCSAGLTQQEAGARVGKDARQVRRWLSGDVPLGALELLAALLPANDSALFLSEKTTEHQRSAGTQREQPPRVAGKRKAA